MAVECQPENLAELGACFACLTPRQREGIKTYLLAVQAGVNPDADELMELAECFLCLNSKQNKAIQTYLLCQMANA